MTLFAFTNLRAVNSLGRSTLLALIHSISFSDKMFCFASAFYFASTFEVLVKFKAAYCFSALAAFVNSRGVSFFSTFEADVR